MAKVISESRPHVVEPQGKLEKWRNHLQMVK